MITHLEPDILECEVKWVLGSITTNQASEGGRIPVELFQILKYDAVEVLHSICQQIWKTQQWPQDWKRSVFILIPKKGNSQRKAMPKAIPKLEKVSFHSNPKERQCQTTAQLHSYHMLAKKHSKFSRSAFKGRTENFQLFKLDL